MIVKYLNRSGSRNSTSGFILFLGLGPKRPYKKKHKPKRTNASYLRFTVNLIETLTINIVGQKLK